MDTAQKYVESFRNLARALPVAAIISMLIVAPLAAGRSPRREPAELARSAAALGALDTAWAQLRAGLHSGSLSGNLSITDEQRARGMELRAVIEEAIAGDEGTIARIEELTVEYLRVLQVPNSD